MIYKNIIGLLATFAVLAIAGCGRPMPNDPAANSEAAAKIRATLVSASKSTGGATAEPKPRRKPPAPAPSKAGLFTKAGRRAGGINVTKILKSAASII